MASAPWVAAADMISVPTCSLILKRPGFIKRQNAVSSVFNREYLEPGPGMHSSRRRPRPYAAVCKNSWETYTVCGRKDFWEMYSALLSIVLETHEDLTEYSTEAGKSNRAKS